MHQAQPAQGLARLVRLARGGEQLLFSRAVLAQRLVSVGVRVRVRVRDRDRVRVRVSSTLTPNLGTLREGRREEQ